METIYSRGSRLSTAFAAKLEFFHKLRDGPLNGVGGQKPCFSQNGARQYFRVKPKSIRVDVRIAEDSASCYGVNLDASTLGFGFSGICDGGNVGGGVGRVVGCALYSR